jgi:dTDP-glucose 4,6-dehydratase
MNGNPLAPDLDKVLKHTEPIWSELRGARIFVTGGTGFFGCWLLETFAWANERLNLGAQMLVLTRNAEGFQKKARHLGSRSDIQFQRGDVKDFIFPAGSFTHVIHAATESASNLGEENPGLMLETITAGTRRALEFAISSGAKKFLLTSSGAVYGPQPSEMTHIAEEYNGGPDVSSVRSVYAEGKRVAELQCAIASRQHGLETKIARCFAFVGPYLPLDVHFAIGNFIRDAMAGGPIRINGDGTPFRSYLYAGDLAGWLWTILLLGANNRAYNVGSSQSVTIAETAEEVVRALGKDVAVNIAQKPTTGKPAQRYVPNVNRAVSELHLDQWTPLDEAIRATARWHQRPRS